VFRSLWDGAGTVKHSTNASSLIGDVLDVFIEGEFLPDCKAEVFGMIEPVHWMGLF